MNISEWIFGSDLKESDYPGLKYISALLDTVEDKHDYWLVYELGGPNLTKNLFEVKGEFFNGEWIYHVQHNEFYYAIKENRRLL